MKAFFLKTGMLAVLGVGICFGQWGSLVPANTLWVMAEENDYEYVSVTGKNLVVYQDAGKTIASKVEIEPNQTFLVKETQSKGIINYLAIHDAKRLIGYIDASQVTKAEGPEGIEKILRDYVEIVDPTEIYEDFEWKVIGDTKDRIGETYRVKSLFSHFNGDVYLSLYDTDNQWVGYVDQDATISSDRQSFASGQTKTTETTASDLSEETEESIRREPADTSRGTMADHEEVVANVDKHFITGSTNLSRVSNSPSSPSTVRQTVATSTTGEITWTNNASFVEAIAPEAQKLADEYGLYPSVMIAQAILESGFGASKLSKEANNLFGIKYSKSDAGRFASYDIPSDEVINGVRVTLPASFRKYETVADSLQDNAKLLANGLSYNAKFYQGAWRSNAATYQEATRALTGKYATDPDYHTKLNKLIENWNLAQYD